MLGRLGFRGDGACEPFHVAGSSILRTSGHASMPDFSSNALCEHQGLFCSQCAHVRPVRALLALTLPAGQHKQIVHVKRSGRYRRLSYVVSNSNLYIKEIDAIRLTGTDLPYQTL